MDITIIKKIILTALTVALALFMAYGMWFFIVWLAVWGLSMALEFDYTLKQVAGIALFVMLFYICFVNQFNTFKGITHNG